MKTSISKPIAAGLIATTIMTIVMFMAPLMGLPKMNAAAMLSIMFGVPLFAGWVIHYMIGTIFAFGYSLIISKLLSKVSSPIFKGVLFGFIALVFAQIMMALMGMLIPMPPSNANMGLMLLGSAIGYIVFGIAVAELLVDRNTIKNVKFAKSI